jgi:hypothetical protein
MQYSTEQIALAKQRSRSDVVWWYKGLL